MTYHLIYAMKVLVLIIVCSISSIIAATSQTPKEASRALKELKTIEQLEEFKTKYADWNIQLLTVMGIYSAKYPWVVHAKAGKLYTYDNGRNIVVFKVLNRNSVEICKVQYIYLDGSAMNRNTADSTRDVILNRYRNGTDFVALVKEYTMDHNPTGGLEWFYKGQMVTEFEEAAMPRQKGEIFKVDVESRNWYYVVLKTDDNKTTTVTETVRIQCNM